MGREKSLFFLSVIDRHLKQLKDDKHSIYYQIMDRYIAEKVTRYEFSDTALYLIRYGIALLVIFILATIYSRFEVHRQTAAQRKYAERLQLSLDSSMSGMWDWDMEEDKAVLDKTCASMLGYTLDELPAPSFSLFRDLVHPDDMSGYESYLKQVLSSGDGKVDYELRMKEKRGDWKWVLLRGRVNYDGRTREPLRMYGTITDIDSIKKTQREVQELKERYETIFNNRHAVMLIIDPEDGTIMDANPAAINFYGWSREELKHINITEINTLKREEVLAEMKDAKDGSRSYFIFKHRLADGSVRDVEVYGGKIVIEGKPLLYSIIHDITPRLKMEREKEFLERQLRHSQKLETVGTLAGGIAHDFNNILMPIIGYAGIALHKIKDKKDPLYGYLDSILSAGNRARDLVKQLLTFSKQTEHEKKPEKLSDIVKETMPMLRSVMPATIKIEENFCSDCRFIMGDATQLQQVVVNLCTNAYHAMEDHGGRLEVEVKKAEFNGKNDLLPHGLDPEKEYVILRISDTGTGMDEETMERIFEPFFTTKGVDKGTGMGMAIVHGIIQAHDGEITVDSAPGKGTEFKIYFPMSDIVKKSHVDEKVENMVKGSGRILLADDDPDIRNMMKDFLSGLGYEVTVAANGKEALGRIERGSQFDILLTDLTMPGINGLEIAASARKNIPEMNIILMTGYGENVTAKAMMDAGIDTFVMKPLDLSELSHIIKKYVSNRGKS